MDTASAMSGETTPLSTTATPPRPLPLHGARGGFDFSHVLMDPKGALALSGGQHRSGDIADVPEKLVAEPQKQAELDRANRRMAFQGNLVETLTLYQDARHKESYLVSGGDDMMMRTTASAGKKFSPQPPLVPVRDITDVIPSVTRWVSASGALDMTRSFIPEEFRHIEHLIFPSRSGRTTVYNEATQRFLEKTFPSDGGIAGRNEIYQLAEVMDELLRRCPEPTQASQTSTEPKGSSAKPKPSTRESGRAPHTPRPPPKRKGTANSAKQDRDARAGDSSTKSTLRGEEGAKNSGAPKGLWMQQEEQYAQYRSHVLNVMLLGWTELTRQCFHHIAEQGLLMERIRCAVMTMLHDALATTEYYKRMLREVDQYNLEGKLAELSEEMMEKDHKIGALELQNERLQEEIESLQPAVEELERLRSRETILQDFILRQSKRNAELLQMKELLETTGGAGFKALKKAKQKSRLSVASRQSGLSGGAEETTSELGDSFMLPSGSMPVTPSGEGFALRVSEANGNKKLTQEALRVLGEEEEEEEEEEEAPPVDASVQVNMDHQHDDSIYLSFSTLMNHMSSVTDITEQLVGAFYGSGSVAYPSLMVGSAKEKLADIVARAKASEERAKQNAQINAYGSSIIGLRQPTPESGNRGGGGGSAAGGEPLQTGAGVTSAGIESPSGAAHKIPHRGFYELSKPFIVSLLKDTNQGLKEIKARIVSLNNHEGLKDRLAPSMQAPTTPGQQCPLCKRVEADPMLAAKATQDQEALRIRIEKIQTEKDSLLIEKRTNKVETDRLKKENMTQEEEIAKLEYKLMMIKVENALVDSATQTIGGAVSGPRSPSASKRRGSHLAVSPGSPDLAATTGALNVDSGGAPFLSPTLEERESSPLQINLVINCHCQSEGGAPTKSSGGPMDSSVVGPRGTPLFSLTDVDTLEQGAVEGAAQSRRNRPSAVSILQQGEARTARSRGPSVAFGESTTSEKSVSTPPPRALSPRLLALAQPFDLRGSEGSSGKSQSQQALEKKRNELASRIRALIEVPSDAVLTAKPKMLIWILKQINSVYKSKAKSDSALTSEGWPILTCLEHVADYLRQTYGMKKLVEESMINLLATTRHWTGKDKRILLFSHFFEDHKNFSLSTYYWFIRFNKAIEEALPHFGDAQGLPQLSGIGGIGASPSGGAAKHGVTPKHVSTTADEDRVPQTVPVECIRHALDSLFRGKAFYQQAVDLLGSLATPSSAQQQRARGTKAKAGGGAEMETPEVVVRSDYNLEFCKIIDAHCRGLTQDQKKTEECRVTEESYDHAALQRQHRRMQSMSLKVGTSGRLSVAALASAVVRQQGEREETNPHPQLSPSSVPSPSSSPSSHARKSGSGMIISTAKAFLSPKLDDEQK